MQTYKLIRSLPNLSLMPTSLQWINLVGPMATMLVLWPLVAAGGIPSGSISEASQGSPAQISASGEVGAEGLSLYEVVQTALVSNPSIQTAVQQVFLGEGELHNARAQFSPNLSATISRSHARDLSIGSGGLGQAAERDTEETSYSVTLTQQLRAGITVQPSVTVSQTRSTTRPETLGSATVNLDLILPLLRDRWGKIAKRNEQAAEEGYASDLRELNHQQAASILETVTAFWDYVSTHRQLDVYRLSEERAQLLVEETRQLVEAEERPAADLNQVEGNAASKRIDRINAEQRVIVARQRLGVAMGIAADQIPMLQPPRDDFPDIKPYAEDGLTRERLVETALQNRADLEAAARQQRVSELLFEAAKENLKPKLDMVLSTGYTGADEGTGIDQLVSPLYRHVPGMTTSVLLDYSFPIKNLSGRGIVMQQGAALEQQRIAARDLARRISAAVTVAYEDLLRSALAAETAEHAVALIQKTVENEKEKNRLGVATLFDVILAENSLTGALLNRVASYRDYAVALVSLRYEIGLLVYGQGAEVTVNPQELTAPP